MVLTEYMRQSRLGWEKAWAVNSTDLRALDQM